MEAAGDADAGIVALEDGEHRLDRIPDAIVIGNEVIPVDHRALSQRRLGNAGDDRDLAEEMLRCRLVAAAGRMHHRHRVFHRDRLRPRRLDVDLGTAETRQDQGCTTMNEMAAVELGGDVGGQIEIAQRSLRRLPVRYGRGKIAAHCEESLHLAADHGFQRGYHVVSRRGRRLEAEALLQPLEEVRLGDFRDPHGPIALHVGMTANRADAGAFAPHIAAQQREIGDLLHVIRAAPVLGDAHAVHEDGTLGLHISAGGIFHVLARQAGLTFDVRPLRALEIVDQRLDADGVTADEIPVQDLRPLGGAGCFVGLHKDLHDSLEDGDVAADPYLEEF